VRNSRGIGAAHHDLFLGSCNEGESHRDRNGRRRARGRPHARKRDGVVIARVNGHAAVREGAKRRVVLWRYVQGGGDLEAHACERSAILSMEYLVYLRVCGRSSKCEDLRERKTPPLARPSCWAKEAKSARRSGEGVGNAPRILSPDMFDRDFNGSRRVRSRMTRGFSGATRCV
jgi:hypothetical protein